MVPNRAGNLPEAKATFVLSGLFSAGVFCLILISIGISDHIFEYTFLAGISTGIISGYYEP